MRDSTEWVELVDSGWNTLVGADTDKICSALCSISKSQNHPALYGTGNKRCRDNLFCTNEINNLYPQ